MGPAPPPASPGIVRTEPESEFELALSASFPHCSIVGRGSLIAADSLCLHLHSHLAPSRRGHLQRGSFLRPLVRSSRASEYTRKRTIRPSLLLLLLWGSAERPPCCSFGLEEGEMDAPLPPCLASPSPNLRLQALISAPRVSCCWRSNPFAATRLLAWLGFGPPHLTPGHSSRATRPPSPLRKVALDLLVGGRRARSTSNRVASG